MSDWKRKKFRPETLMMSYGFEPTQAEGAVKSPIYQTSTFAFQTAEEGKAFFEVAYGLREARQDEKLGMIYSRVNNPDLEILEKRLCLWEDAEEGAVFESGMSAITTTLLEFLQPGDLFLHSAPVYGGTAHFINSVLTRFGIQVIGFHAHHSPEAIRQMIRDSGRADRLGAIFIETPANPTNDLIDIREMRNIADAFSTPERQALLVVDNTYLGPIFQHPLQHGADLVVYSATKYIGGHSDLIAGAVLGPSKLLARVKNLRTLLGSMAAPWTSWLLMRSLETLKLRMERQAKNARRVARFLQQHPKVEKVHYLGLLTPDNEQSDIYQRQWLGPGAMVSFNIVGGEKEAFTFLNNLHLIKLAVSLGSTESLAQHPATMTHAGLPYADKEAVGVTDNLVRISVGVGNVEDLIMVIGEALEMVKVSSETEELVDGRV